MSQEDKLMFTIKKRIVAILCVSSLFMSPSVTLAGENWTSIKKHFKKYEIKIQGCTTEQWAAIVNPEPKVFYENLGGKSSKLTTKKKVLYAVGAAVAVGGIIYVIAEYNDSDDPIAYAAEGGQ
jgi:hypothetical protein